MREGGEMSSNSNVEEERLAGVPRRPRKDGEISSNKESKWSMEHGRQEERLAGVPSRLRKGGEQQEHGRQEERLAGVPSRPRKGGVISSNEESKWRDWQEVETNSNTDGKWRHWREYQGGRSTKEAKERWGDNQTDSLITQGLTLHLRVWGL